MSFYSSGMWVKHKSKFHDFCFVCNRKISAYWCLKFRGWIISSSEHKSKLIQISTGTQHWIKTKLYWYIMLIRTETTGLAVRCFSVLLLCSEDEIFHYFIIEKKSTLTVCSNLVPHFFMWIKCNRPTHLYFFNTY